MRSRRGASSSSRRSACANASSSPGCTSNPVRPSSMNSGCEPLSEQTWARPACIASSTVRLPASLTTEGETQRSACGSSRLAPRTKPAKKTLPRSASSEAVSRSAATKRSSPVPTSTTAKSCSASRAQARSSTSHPFSGTRRPQKSSSGVAGAMPKRRRRSAAGSPSDAATGSGTLLWMTQSLAGSTGGSPARNSRRASSETMAMRSMRP